MNDLINWFVTTLYGGGPGAIILVVCMLALVAGVLTGIVKLIVWIFTKPDEAFGFLGAIIVLGIIVAIFGFGATSQPPAGPGPSTPESVPQEGTNEGAELTPIAEVTSEGLPPPPPPPAQPTPTLDPAIPVYDPNNPTIGQVNLTPAPQVTAQANPGSEQTVPQVSPSVPLQSYVGGSGMQATGCPTIVIRTVSTDENGWYVFDVSVNGLETTWRFDPKIETITHVFQPEGGCYLHLRVDATQQNNQGMPAILWHMQAS